jgi:hypothetical protein
MIQKRREVARVIGDVVPVGSGFGKPVAALVVSDDAEIGREDFGDLIPDAESVPSELMKTSGGPSRRPWSEKCRTRPLAFMNFMAGDFQGVRCRRAGRFPLPDESASGARRAAAPFRG